MKPLLTLVGMLYLAQIAAQTEMPGRLMFKMSPQHLTMNTLKAGVEVFNRAKPASIVVFVKAASNNAEKEPYPLFPYKGIGLELAHRKYIAPIREATNRKGKPFTQGIYFSLFLQGGAYKGDYDFLDVHYDFVTQVRTETQIKYSESAQQIAAGFTIGLQRIFWKTLAVEAFIGTGYQVGFNRFKGDKPNTPYALRQDSALDNAGYSGVIPKGGILLGIFLK